MRPIDVGVGHDDDLVVTELAEIELLADPRADCRDQRLNLFVAKHLVDARPLHVQDLAADRQDRLEPGVTRLFRAPARTVALDDEQLRLFGIA